MNDNLPAGLPLFSKIADPKASKNVRNVVRDIVSNDEVMRDLVPLFVNGGVCGHKVMDVAAGVDLIVAFDKDHGDRLPAFGMNKKVLGDNLKAVLRERYDLNKAWKIDGLSKRVRLADQSRHDAE